MVKKGHPRKRALAVKVQSLISSKLIISLMNYAAYLFQVKQHENGDICNKKKSMMKTSTSVSLELVENLAAGITSIQNNNKMLDEYSQ